MDTRCTGVKVTGPDSAHPNGAFEAVVPAFADEWATLPERIPVFAGGDMSPDHTIGSAAPSWDEHGDLRFIGIFRSTDRAAQAKRSLHEGQHTIAPLFMGQPPSRELIAVTVVSPW